MLGRISNISTHAHHCQGFTLVEVAMVALIIGIIAALAMPTGSNAAVTKVEAAAAEVAAAIRFARDESIRTGDYYGVRQRQSNNKLRVFRFDAGTYHFDVYHPTAKQLWDIKFDDSPQYRGIKTSRDFDWRGPCDKARNITFRDGGVPVCPDPTTTLLDQATIKVSMDDISRDVVLDGFTGQVWIQ